MVREGRPVGSRSWIPRHLQGISINSLNQFVFSLFRTNCTTQDKETALAPLSRMTWMYKLIWLVGKAESLGLSCGAQNLLDSEPQRYTRCKPTSACQGWEPGEAGAHPVGRWEWSLNAEQELLVCLVRCQFTNHGNVLLRPTRWISPKRPQIMWTSLPKRGFKCWGQQWAQLPASH